MTRRAQRALGILVALSSILSSACSGDDSPAAGSSSTASTSVETAEQPTIDPTAECPDVAFAPCDVLVASQSIPLDGSGWSLAYSSDRVPGRTAAPTGDVRGLGLGGWMLSGVHVLAGDVLLLSGGGRRIVTPVEGAPGEQVVASVDGDEAYVFDDAGRHLRTVSTDWGIVTRTMSYDDDGRLLTVRDVYGDELSVERDPSNLPTALVGAGANVALVTDARGFLTRVTDAVGSTYTMTPDPNGLINRFVDPDERSTSYGYDSAGRLTSTTDSSGAKWMSTWTDLPDGHRIEHTTPTGESASLTVELVEDGHLRSTIVGTDGRTSVADAWEDGRRQLVAATGGTTTAQLAPDPRFAMTAPVIAHLTHSDPTGSSEATTSIEVEGQSNDDPLAFERVVSTLTDAGATTTIVTDRGALTQTITAPGGAITEMVVDSHGDVVRLAEPGQEPTTIVRDDHGTALTTQQGAQGSTKVATDPATGIATVTDALGRSTTFQRNRQYGTMTIGMADGRSVTYRSTPNGTPVSAIGPGGATEIRNSDEHGLPSGGVSSATGLQATTTTRDESGRISSIERGDGSIVVERDAAGRVVSITTPAGATRYTYDPETGLVTDVMAPGDIGSHYVYAAATLATEEWSGAVTGAVGFEFDELGRPRALVVAGASSAIDYDSAGRRTAYGAATFGYNTETGALETRTVGSVTTKIFHDALGRQDAQTVTVDGRGVYSESVTFDAVGRVVTRTETVDGATSTTTYGYDLTDRLVSVTVDAGTPTTYRYDEGDNMVERGGVAPVIATYDAAGHVVTAGDAAYAFDDDGVLASKTDAAGTTTYDYDVQGNLRGVGLPDGRLITYLIDGSGRRVGKEIDGDLVAGWLYAGNEVVAELDGDGDVVATYVDGASGGPVVMERDGTNAIVSDRWGSPRLIVDVETGEVVDRIDRDVWGRVTAESAGGATSLGFLGGIEDPDTGLVHLGARDYDPSLGRFTSPDPAGIHGVRTNVYAYAGNNPVNRVDASGWSDEELDKKNAAAVFGLLGDLLQAISNMAAITDGAAGNFFEIGQSLSSFVVFSQDPNNANAFAALANFLAVVPKIPGLGDSHGEVLGVVGKGLTAAKSTVEFGWAVGKWAAGKGSAAEVGRAMVKFAWDMGNFFQAYYALFPGSAPTWLPLVLRGLGLLGLALAVACFVACKDDAGDTPGRKLWRRLFGPGSDSLDGPEDDSSKRGKSWGDPHLMTFDEHPYDFQAVGEFTLVRSTTDDFEVQIRTAPISNQAPVSVIVGIAIRINGHRITSVDDGPGILIDGAAMSGPSLQLPDGTVVIRDSSGEPTVVLADGTQVSQFNGLLGTTMIGLASQRVGAVEGLLGNADDDPDNDLVLTDGTVIETNRLDDVRLLAAAWRVTPETSLFDYAAGTDTTTFTDLEAPRAALTLGDLDEATRETAAQICRNAGVTEQPYLDSCTLDVAVSGDVSYALAAREATLLLPSDEAPDPELRETFDIAVGDTVEPGSPADGAGVLEGALDADVYTFTVDEPTTVTVTANLDLTTTAASNGLDWHVLSSDGSSLQNGSFDGDPSASTGVPVKVALPAAGQYQLIVRRHDDDDAPLEYGFALAATTTGSTGVESGKEYSGSIDAPGDTRDFEFTVTAGQALAIEDLTPCDVGADLRWSVIDESGQLAILPVAAAGTATGMGRTGDFCDAVGRLQFPTAGTYRFQVTSSSWTGDFTFMVSTPRDDRFAIKATDEVRPGQPGAGAGNIESPGSLDIYTFDVTEPIFYKLDTAPAVGTCTGGVGSPLTLYAPSGKVVVAAAPTCADRETVRLIEVGTYTIVVGSYDDDGLGIATGPYRFQFTR